MTAESPKPGSVHATPALPAGEPVWRALLGSTVAGPLVALLLACLVFSLGTRTFLRAENISLIFQQSVVVGTLALGQTLIILTAGIDLANGSIAVLGMVVMAKYVVEGGDPIVALLLGFVVCMVMAAISGTIVSRFNLPPFIVTLGMLTAIAASTRLYSSSASYTVPPSLLTWLGNSIKVGGATVPYSIFVWLALFAVAHYALTQTAAGRHLFAVGDNIEAARLAGINVRRTLLSVYVVAGAIYAIGAWEALGRIPVADPNGYSTANLDSITAVVIGGTSLFGGRGGVFGTLIGTLIVAVLANGLTQANIDSLYQQVAIGILVIVAVAVDQLVRRRRAS
ncbi:MAG: ABC transporter permease [Candidatus Limnocylindrales bacterium]